MREAASRGQQAVLTGQTVIGRAAARDRSAAAAGRRVWKQKKRIKSIFYEYFTIQLHMIKIESERALFTQCVRHPVFDSRGRALFAGEGALAGVEVFLQLVLHLQIGLGR